MAVTGHPRFIKRLASTIKAINGKHSCSYTTTSDPGQPTDFRSTLMQYPGGSVDLEKDEKTGIAKIKLNHVERKNALSGHMMCDLSDIVDDLAEWANGKGVILYGAAGTFCSGGDLNLMRAIGESEKGHRMSIFMHRTMAKFRKLPFISVALIEGRALGGGAELTTACDFRLMTSGAQIGFVQARLGIVPGWTGGYGLTQIVGRMTALELLSTAQIMKGEEALKCGLASEIIKDESSAMQEAEVWLSKRTQAPASTLQAVKKIVLNSSNPDLNAALEEERNIFKSVWGAEAHETAMGKGIKHK